MKLLKKWASKDLFRKKLKLPEIKSKRLNNSETCKKQSTEKFLNNKKCIIKGKARLHYLSDQIDQQFKLNDIRRTGKNILVSKEQ